MGKILVDACVTCGGNCYGCFHADQCQEWLDEAPYSRAQITADCAVLALCESRHDMPEEVEGSIFPNTIDPTDIRQISFNCAKALKAAVTEKEYKYLKVYVTGLTVALIEVVNWCALHKVHLTLMHFNRDTGEYYPQDVRVI